MDNNCYALTLYNRETNIMMDKKGNRRIGKRAYPLRKIVAENVPAEINGSKVAKTNLLECGHYVYRSSDIYGETCPSSQRCRQCYENNKLINNG